MNPKYDQIISDQKESWNKFSSAWRKWDKFVHELKKPISDKMLEVMNLSKHHVVLDIASGTGEPALSIAEITTEGKVIATDLSEEMLKVAMEKADKRGIKNFETNVSRADMLPFPDGMFDQVSCRFGIMFFPDMHKTLKEMIRVLKPGGKIVAAVWNVPDKNLWVTAMQGVLKKFLEMPRPQPDEPGMFRCSEKDFMINLFTDAGLINVTQTEVISKDNYGSAKTYWDMVTEMSVAVVNALEKTNEETKQKIKEELFSTLDKKFPDGNVSLDSSAIVVCGEKK